MTKRILIFSTAYYPFVGGAETAIKEITDILSDDFQFDLLTAKLEKDLPEVEKIGAVTVYRIGIGRPLLDKLFLPFRGALKIRQLQKDNDYFCFWAVMATFSSGAGYIFNILEWLFGRKQIPIVLTLQEGDSEDYLTYKWAGLVNLSWKLALKRAAFLTAISRFLLNRAEKIGYKCPAEVIPNGVNISLFSKIFTPAEKVEVERMLGKKDGDIFLVTSSRLAKKNAVDDIISALKNLPENISLIVIGKGEEGCSLQKQAERLGLQKRVKFLGFVPQKEIPKYFSVCDIFIRPSRSEGFGNSFIEAMAARLPVIATPVGGIPDFIDDKQTGVFCAPDNPQSIVLSVRMLIENPKLKDYIVENAFRRVSEKYSWDLVAKQMKERVFDKVL
jgi:glycosyltransferase involved in cell wall biosynthesis